MPWLITPTQETKTMVDVLKMSNTRIFARMQSSFRVILVSQQFALYFKGKSNGHIINISSIYGLVPPRFEVYEDSEMTTPVEYAAIKSALIHLNKYMLKYFYGCGIRFNCISPGGIKNDQPNEFLSKYNSFGNSKGMLDLVICQELWFFF